VRFWMNVKGYGSGGGPRQRAFGGKRIGRLVARAYLIDDPIKLSFKKRLLGIRLAL